MVMRKTEPMDNLSSDNVLLSSERSSCMKMSTEKENLHHKNDHSSPKMHSTAKLPITDPPKVWVSGFLSVNGNGEFALVIMEKWKNCCSFPKTCPLKVWVSSFPSVNRNGKFALAIMKKWL